MKDALEETFRALAEGRQSPELTCMELLLRCGTLEEATRAVKERLHARRDEQLEQAARLLSEHQPKLERIEAMIASGMDRHDPGASAEENLDSIRRLFDWSVTQDEEASVALYSLGSPSVLRRATQEVVEAMDRWGVLGTHRRALDLGCGTGRFEEALASRLAHIRAIDLSDQMLAVARRRHPKGNVRFELTDGHGVSGEAESLDLVFAVDSFPYVRQVGLDSAEAHFRDIHRLLRPGGDFVLLNYSYLQDESADLEEVQRLAQNRFELAVFAEKPFSLWNGLAFHLRKLKGTSTGPPGPSSPRAEPTGRLAS